MHMWPNAHVVQYTCGPIHTWSNAPPPLRDSLILLQLMRELNREGLNAINHNLVDSDIEKVCGMNHTPT